MSRLLLLNFEDFGLNQDITKTIQSFIPFCICCLDREGPMFDLDTCEHSDYLDAFDKPQLKQFNQLVCLQCHNILQKIKCFQAQILETYDILLSGSYTNTTVNSKRLNKLALKKMVDIVQLPLETETSLTNDIMDDNIESLVEENILGLENNEEDYTASYLITLPKEGTLIQEDEGLDIEEILEENIEGNTNIKTALEILERNNQSFVTFGSQLQFLNGEHLSFLEPSLLSKEILTDMPVVPAKNLSTDLDNELINNCGPLEIEIGPDNNFYDGLALSPELIGEEVNISDIINMSSSKIIKTESEPQISKEIVKPKKEKKVKNAPVPIITVKLTPEQLNRERVIQAQSNSYLKYKFRCDTCLVGFNFEENLKDHIKRKHKLKNGYSVICSICYQAIPSAGGLTEHNYRHYTRYECTICNKRYKTQNDALQHSVSSICVRVANHRHRAAQNKKRTDAKSKRSKSKRKEDKNEP